MGRAAIVRGGAASLTIVTPAPVAARTTAMSDVEARAAAHDEGYALGYEEARASVEAAARRDAERTHRELSLALTSLSEASRAARELLSSEQRTLEHAAVRLAFEIARAVIARELQVADSRGADAVRRALEATPLGDATLVRLHPSDLATLGGLEARLDHARIVADSDISAGSCIVEIDTVVIDARIDAALERVRHVLEEATAP